MIRTIVTCVFALALIVGCEGPDAKMMMARQKMTDQSVHLIGAMSSWADYADAKVNQGFADADLAVEAAFNLWLQEQRDSKGRLVVGIFERNAGGELVLDEAGQPIRVYNEDGTPKEEPMPISGVLLAFRSNDLQKDRVTASRQEWKEWKGKLDAILEDYKLLQQKYLASEIDHYEYHRRMDVVLNRAAQFALSAAVVAAGS